MTRTQIHATCVEIAGLGVLLRGPPGSGKSDLALRLIEDGAGLVADDRTDLEAMGERLIASAPDTIAGRLEVRGVGIVEYPAVSRLPVALVVDLRRPEEVERMPPRGTCDIAGVALPCMDLAPFEASAPAKLRLALRLATGFAGTG